MREKIFYSLGVFLLFYSFAWSKPKADTIYYLIDTAKTSADDRMWDIQSDDQFKHYVIQCPCLKFNGKPTFFNEMRDKGQIITKTQLKAIKLISLSELILRSKAFLDNNASLAPFPFILSSPMARIISFERKSQ